MASSASSTSSAAAHHRMLPPQSHSAGRSQVSSRLTVTANATSSQASPRTTKFTLAMKGSHTRAPGAASPLQQTAATVATSTAPTTPKRPMSASRVQPTAASLARALNSPLSVSSSPARHAQTRPVSASRAHVASSPQYQPLLVVDTIAFPSECTDMSSRECEPPPPAARSSRPAAARVSETLRSPLQTAAKSPRSLPSAIAGVWSTIRHEQLQPPTPMDATERAKLRAFLESWRDDAPSFRSAILFSETTFAQAKAMVAEWPTPNSFLSAIAYGCLEQFGLFLAKEYPFLSEVITELGAAVYSNFGDLLELQRQQELEPHASSLPQQQQQLEPHNRFLFYLQHGQHWFHELAEQKRRVESLQFTTASSRDEVQRLTAKLHAQQTARIHESSSFNRAGSDAEAPRVVLDDALGNFEPTAAQFPQLRNLLYCDAGRSGVAASQSSPGSVRLDIHARDYDFWPCCEEIVLVFQSMPRKEAMQMLSALLERAAELELPGLGETYAVGVDLLREPERRAFLREYFLLVAPAELQDALQQRDECNDEKRWQLFVDELKDRLGIADSDDCDDCDDDGVDDSGIFDRVNPPLHGPGNDIASGSGAEANRKQQSAAVAAVSKRLTRFHTDEAKVGAKVHDMVELLEDLAAEASFLDEHHSGFSPTLLKKLRMFEDPTKRITKARELMMNARSSTARTAQPPDTTASQPCACHCGRHELVYVDDLAALQAAISVRTTTTLDEDPDDDSDVANKSSNCKTSRRPSTLKRPFSARRKNAMNYGSRLASPRDSTTQLRLFPLAEVCHMLSAILHLQFSRDTAEMTVTAGAIATSRSGVGGRNSVVALSAITEDRWSFLRRASKPATFKTLAKDFLTRKYGIKSIAVMHTLQLERSLVYYSAMDKHVRCELFAWFFGADKLRLASKDYAFRFFQRLVKSIMSLFVSKRPAAPLSSPASSVVSTLGTSASQQPAPLSLATLVSIWTEYIGDGEATLSDASTATGALVRYLAPSHAIEACNLAFPARIKETSEFSDLLERLYRVGLERDQVELEAFLKRVMEVWQSVFNRFADDVLATLEPSASVFDFDAFTAAVARNGMELTGGERLEIFDLLSQDSDESVVSRSKLLGFFLEAKYLRASGS